MSSDVHVPSSEDVLDLLAGDPSLSQHSVDLLTAHNVGDSIRDALQMPILDVDATEVLLVSMMIDDSGSISDSGNTQNIIDGVNHVREALLQDADIEGIQLMIRYLNGYVLYPYGDVQSSPVLDDSNYHPTHGTPLFDQSFEFLKAILARTNQFVNQGIPARSISLIVTDGEDLHSIKHNAQDVRSVLDEMQSSENHLVCGMGVNVQGTRHTGFSPVSFRDVFGSMGIKDEWIYETSPQAGETEEEFRRRIRRGFGRFSSSAARASKSSAAFSQLGGFGN